jgi:four helix bundle protein
VGTIQRFEEIEAWQTARELTRSIYEVSGSGVFARDYGLRDQMRRAAVSIMSNIAEGFESGTQPLFIRYLRYAKASAGEVRAQLYVGLDAGHLIDAEFEELFDLADKCSRQLSRFIAYLESRPAKPGARETVSVYQIEEGDERSNV